MEIDGEQAYQVWHVQAEWVEDGKHNPKRAWQHEGLPEGRIRNKTSNYKMYRVDVSEADVARWGWEWAYGFKAFQDQSASDLKISVTFKWYETWCIKWFNHYTFDIGQPDNEAERSFSRFVSRMEDRNHSEGKMENGLWHDVYCLMGAEERYRWKGPCRCEHCKKLGLIHMDH